MKFAHVTFNFDAPVMSIDMCFLFILIQNKKKSFELLNHVKISFQKQNSNFLYTQNSNKIGQVIASTCWFIISTKKTQDYFLDYIF